RPVGNPGGEGTCLTESVLKNASARSMGLGVRNSSTARLTRALFCSPDMAALPFCAVLPFSCARVRSTVVLRENDKLSGDFFQKKILHTKHNRCTSRNTYLKGEVIGWYPLFQCHIDERGKLPLFASIMVLLSLPHS